MSRRGWFRGLRGRVLTILLPSALPMLAVVIYGYVSASQALEVRVGQLSHLALRDGTMHLDQRLAQARQQFESWIRHDNKDRFGLSIELHAMGVAEVDFAAMMASDHNFALLVLTDQTGKVLVAMAPGGRPVAGATGQMVPEARDGLAWRATDGDFTVDLMDTSLPELAGLSYRHTYVFSHATRGTAGEVNGCLLAYLDQSLLERGIQEIRDRLRQCDLPRAELHFVDDRSRRVLSPGQRADAGALVSEVSDELVALLTGTATPSQQMVPVAWRGEYWYVSTWPLADLRSPAPGMTAGASRAGDMPALVAVIPERDFSGAARRFLGIGLAFSLLGMLITGIAVWMAGNHIVTRVLRTVDKLRSLTRDEADLSRRMEVDSDDELGELAVAMNLFMERLDHLITSRRQAEEAYRAVVEHSLQGLAIVQRGRVAFANQAFADLHGYTVDEMTALKSSHVRVLVHPEDRDGVTRSVVQAQNGEAQRCSFRTMKRDGTVRVVECFINRVDYREHAALQYAIMDITERKQLEEQLIQAQRMEAVARLAGGVAHDFNNQLTGILGYASMLQTGVLPPERIQHAAVVIETAAKRAAALTRQLLGFARRGKLQHTAVDIHAVIREVVELIGQTSDRRITVGCEFAADDVQVMGDPAQLQQVLMNLAVNAVDAIPGAGRLEFRTRLVPSPPELTASDVSTGRSCLQIDIADDGEGIPEAIRQQIFEPFFTTKEQGKGTGMGLATVFGIVRNHGGRIDFDSELGKGTVFHVHLPLAEVATPAPELARSPAPVSGGGHILVVDDEANIRHLLHEMLRLLGYTVAEASDGKQALRVFREQGVKMDLVILDVNMPVLGGAECLDALMRLDPDVSVLVATGYAMNGDVQRMLDAGACGVIHKPFEFSQLSREIAKYMKVSI